MESDERELEKFGEQFIASFEAIRRSLDLYPPSHPSVGLQLKRFLDNLAELRAQTGGSMVNLAQGEFFVNGTPLKRLSLNYKRAISEWEEKGIGVIAFDAKATAESLLGFFEMINVDADEIASRGGIDKLLAEAGVGGIKAGQVTIGLEADGVSMIEADEPSPFDEDEARDIDEAKQRYQRSFQQLLTTIQSAAAVDPRVRMVRTLSQIVESRLLERRSVRGLAAELRQHDKESYRHALGGAVVAVLMGSALRVESQRLRLLGEAAFLRDIGKLEIAPEDLLNRETNEAAGERYRAHPIIGTKMLLCRWDIDPTAGIVAYEHHAQLDNKGFPRLTTRKSMHAFSRVVAVASAYDRLTGGYPGAPFCNVWEAVGKIIQGVGSLYDPAAVRGFLRVMGCVPEGTPVRLLDGREGFVAGPGRKTWLCPEVTILRDVDGNEVDPHFVTTDDLATPGESVIHSFIEMTEEDRMRVGWLLNAE